MICIDRAIADVSIMLHTRSGDVASSVLGKASDVTTWAFQEALNKAYTQGVLDTLEALKDDGRV
jgi:hypothetical protein